MAGARLVLADSGGIQEETTMLGVPCVTMRSNTERPITREQSTNRLAGGTRQGIVAAVHDALSCHRPNTTPPALWGGRAACRIAEKLK